MDSTLESHEQAVISVLCFLLGFTDNFKYYIEKYIEIHSLLEYASDCKLLKS